MGTREHRLTMPTWGYRTGEHLSPHVSQETSEMEGGPGDLPILKANNLRARRADGFAVETGGGDLTGQVAPIGAISVPH
jgi:hypothetical protein